MRNLAALVAALAATMVAGCSGGDERDSASAPADVRSAPSAGHKSVPTPVSQRKRRFVATDPAGDLHCPPRPASSPTSDGAGRRCGEGRARRGSKTHSRGKFAARSMPRSQRPPYEIRRVARRWMPSRHSLAIPPRESESVVVLLGLRRMADDLGGRQCCRLRIVLQVVLAHASLDEHTVA
jgi:hypothetical protein